MHQHIFIITAAITGFLGTLGWGQQSREFCEQDFYWAYDIEGIRAQLNAGANINCQSSNGTLLIHQFPILSPADVRFLVKAGANVTTADEYGFTPFHILTRAEDVSETIKVFLEAGADINVRSTVGETPLRFAAIGNPENLRSFIEAGADVMFRSDSGKTALHFAAEAGRFENIQILLNSGANPKARSNQFLKEGSTPLHIAAEVGPIESVISLINAGADVNAEDKQGRSVLFYAVDMKDRGNDIETAADHSQDADIIKVLIAAGADVNAATELGQTALFPAVLWSTPEAVTTLIDADADVMATGFLNTTPLHSVFWAQPDFAEISLENIQILLASGADINARRSGGAELRMTPLLMATHWMQPSKVIQFLLESGANVNDKDGKGNTPLHNAAKCQNHSEKICEQGQIQTLLNFGADPKAKNKNGQTPWDLVRINGNLKGTKDYWALNDARYK